LRANSHIGLTKFAIHPVLDGLDCRHPSSRGGPVCGDDSLVHLLVDSRQVKGILRSQLSSLIEQNATTRIGADAIARGKASSRLPVQHAEQQDQMKAVGS
jgi:hypothetical protein